MKPGLVGELILQNINLWIGCHGHSNNRNNNPTNTTAPPTSSTGLHHDYHDNMYIMLHGQKTFRLVDPCHVDSLYPVGDLVRVHHNGRFNYKAELTEADGRSRGSAAAQEASERLKRIGMNKSSSKSTGTGNTGNGTTNSAASDSVDEEDEEEIEAALEALLDAECDGDDCGSGSDEGDWDEDSDSGEDGEGSGSLPVPWMSRAALQSAIATSSSSNNSSTDKNKKPKTQSTVAGAVPVPIVPVVPTPGVKPIPPNFSQLGVLPSSLLLPAMDDNNTTNTPNTMSVEEASHIKEKFPRFYSLLQQRQGQGQGGKQQGKGNDNNNLPGFLEVTLNQGEMLYIPSGWYHEVRSCGSCGSSDCNSTSNNCTSSSNNSKKSPINMHMALNYWFHPPDNTNTNTNTNTDTNSSTSQQPYVNDFWKNDWKERFG